MPDDVQPTEGQGGEATGGLFDSYLQTVPEEARETVTSYLKDASSNVNRHIEEAGEFRKRWEPYSEIDGLSQYEPDNLRQLIAWHQQVASNQDAYQQWLREAAEQAGLHFAEQEQLDPLEDEALTPEKVQELVQQQAAQQLAPLQQMVEQFQAQQQEVVETTAINDAFKAIEDGEKVSLTNDQKEMICQLGLALAVDERGNQLPMGDASWVQKGFERFRQISGEAQRAFVADKTGAPRPPLTTGGTGTADSPKTFDDATRMALERLRQS